MLTIPNHLLRMAINLFQHDLLYDFHREQTEADWPVIPQIVVLAFLEDVCNICISPVIGNSPSISMTCQRWEQPDLPAPLDAACWFPGTCMGWALSSNPWLSPYPLLVALKLELFHWSWGPLSPRWWRLRQRRYLVTSALSVSTKSSAVQVLPE